MAINVNDLEMVILGIVYKQGPCTPYAVRMEFEGSPSSHFSSSPGSIYPIMERLETQQGWLESEESTRGKQRRFLYSLTSSGVKALRGWYTKKQVDEACTMTFDPLRTRMYFIEALTDKQRTRFLQDATTALKANITMAKIDVKRYRESGDLWSELAAKGALASLESRKRWIEELSQSI